MKNVENLFQIFFSSQQGDKATNYLSPLNLDSLPKKSILKKTTSFNLYKFGQAQSPFDPSPYTTVTGAESGVRKAFDKIFQKSIGLRDATPDGDSAPDLDQDKPPPSPTIKKTVQLVRLLKKYFFNSFQQF